MDYTFLADLHKDFAPPEDGILSRILHKDEKVNVTLFGFSPGQEIQLYVKSVDANRKRLELSLQNEPLPGL